MAPARHYGFRRPPGLPGLERQCGAVGIGTAARECGLASGRPSRGRRDTASAWRHREDPRSLREGARHLVVTQMVAKGHGTGRAAGGRRRCGPRPGTCPTFAPPNTFSCWRRWQEERAAERQATLVQIFVPERTPCAVREHAHFYAESCAARGLIPAPRLVHVLVAAKEGSAAPPSSSRPWRAARAAVDDPRRHA
jgi:hypothetical protein